MNMANKNNQARNKAKCKSHNENVPKQCTPEWARCSEGANVEVKDQNCFEKNAITNSNCNF